MKQKSLDRLVNEVEELLTELSHEHGGQIDELRGRIEDSLDSAKRAIASQREGAAKRIGRYVGTVDTYITSYPRLGFLAGVLVGGLLVYASSLVRSDE